MTDLTKQFSKLLNVWRKGYGPKPTQPEFELSAALCVQRPSGKHFLANALYARPGYGASTPEVAAIVSRYAEIYLPGRNPNQGALLNRYRDAEKAGFISRDMGVGKRDGADVYLISPTAKGAKLLQVYREQQALRDAAMPAEPAKPAKPNGKAKPAPKAKVARKAPSKPAGAVQPLPPETVLTLGEMPVAAPIGPFEA